MSGADLLRRHLETLVDDPAAWQDLISPDIVWELPYAPSLGQAGRHSGRLEVMELVEWFRDAFVNFRFEAPSILEIDPQQVVGTVRGDGTVKANKRLYQQEYVVYLRSSQGRIIYLREYFDTLVVARALA